MRVIENLLVLARLELGASQRTEEVDLSLLIEEQVQKHRQTFSPRQLNVAIAEDLPHAMCDPTQIELVLVNRSRMPRSTANPTSPSR
jgi:signal transduction histidine kinase